MDASVTVGGVPIVHRFPTEQRLSTPVPIYFEPPAGMEVHAARLVYKAFGGATYKKVGMSRMGVGFGYEVPCMEVSAGGELKYFIELVGSDGQVLDAIGSRIVPFRVQLRLGLVGAPPSLPGKKPPAQCSDLSEGVPPRTPYDQR